MIRSRGSAARSATVRIGVGVSCQLVLVLAAARCAHGAGAGDQPVVVADQLLQVGEELLLGRPAAVDAHVARRPRACASRSAPTPARLGTTTAAASAAGSRASRSGCRGRAAAASGRCSPPRRAPRPAGTGSRPPGERLASCSAASHSAIASAVTKPGDSSPGLPWSAGTACRSMCTNAARSSCGRRSAGPSRVTQRVDVGVAQEREDLPGGAEHAAALLKRRVHVIEHGGGGELEPVLFEDPRGLVVVRARRPQERLRDRPVGERRGAQEVTRRAPGRRGRRTGQAARPGRGRRRRTRRSAPARGGRR